MIDSDIMQNKRKVMKAIINNPNIVLLLNSAYISDPDALIYTHVFPYLQLPGIQLVTETFITMSLDTDLNKQNKNFKDFTLTLCVLAHESQMKTEYGGTRIDIISGELTAMLNKDDIFGFKMELLGDKENIFNSSYHRRFLTFRTKASNNVCRSINVD